MDYLKALEQEIANESIAENLTNAAKKIWKFLGDLIKRVIAFLRRFIDRRKKMENVTSATTQSTPKSQPTTNSTTKAQPTSSGKSSDPKPEEKSISVVQSVVNEEPKKKDGSKELREAVSLIRVSIESICKRKLPNYKTNAKSEERYIQDNTLIIERLANANEILDRLNPEEYTITTNAAQEIHTELENINKIYGQFGRRYDMFINSRKELAASFALTMQCFNSISDTAIKALNIIEGITDKS